MSLARRAALDVLSAIDRGETTLPAEVERRRRGLEDPRDRALLLELTAGALRWRKALDAVLSSASHRPLDELAPAVRNILRLGAYQLRHLERVPPHAVVHESVELARSAGQSRAAGFVNAVLRSLTRQGPDAGLPSRPAAGASRESQIAYLSTTLSHPEWLVARWLDRYGFDSTEQWCRFNNEAPELTIRLRPDGPGLEKLLEQTGAALRPARYVPGGLVIDAGQLGRLPAGLRESLVIQEEGSQLVALGTPLGPGERLLDLCAAPGNKTALLASRPDTGLVVACDFRPRRVALLAVTIRRAGLRVPVVRLDGTKPLPFGAIFDTVLVDAPCTGLGTIRRDPDLKWIRTESDCARYAGLQLRLLESALTALGARGRLVYATCSSEPDENENVIRAFLEQHPELVVRPVTFAAAVAEADELVDESGFLRTWPPRHGVDAFFAAVLERRRAA